MYIYFLTILLAYPLLAETPTMEIDTIVVKNTQSGQQELTVSEIHSIKKGNTPITILILSNGSKWEVKPEDASIAQSWFIPHELKIEANQDPEYPYTITNQVTGSSILVKKKKQSVTILAVSQNFTFFMIKTYILVV